MRTFGKPGSHFEKRHAVWQPFQVSYSEICKNTVNRGVSKTFHWGAAESPAGKMLNPGTASQPNNANPQNCALCSESNR